MTLLIFVFLLLAVIFAWIGKQKPANYLYIITMILAVVWFLHHITTPLSLQL